MNTSRLKIHYTCSECHSGNEVYPPEVLVSEREYTDQCHVCGKNQELLFLSEHCEGKLSTCVVCERKDFYQQKDFNRKMGVVLFVIAAILSIWTYGISLIVLYLVDLFLFSRIGNVVVCYKCQTIYRNVANLSEIQPFNHEMNDRIVYSDHDFQGKNLAH
jgi:hypothetical protein